MNEKSDEIKISINDLVKKVHDNAVVHGWWDGDERKLGEIIVLMHSELSEAVEEYRNSDNLMKSCINPEHYYSGDDGYLSNTSKNEISKPEGMEIELANCVIRIMDLFGQRGWDLEKIIIEKNNYNKSRPYKHGGKKI